MWNHKTMKTNTLIVFLSCAAAVACAKVQADNAHAGDQKPRITVRFTGYPSAPVNKGGTCADENQVTDMNVWCYLDGKLDAFSYDESERCSVRLYEGREYSVYAIANIGPVDPPFLENDALKEKYVLPDLSGDPFCSSIPMSTPSAVCLNTGNATGMVPLELSRMFAKYNLRIGKHAGTVSQLEIKSIRVRNSPGEMFYFVGNCAGGLTVDGDSVIPGASCSEASLFLAENLCSGPLDEDHCTFIEIKGRLKYEDRPSMNSVYLLDQDMTYRWYFRDMTSGEFSIKRNTEYTASFTWSDFGWIADPEHVIVDNVIEDNSYCITFCDENGLPVSGAEYEGLDESSVIDIYYRTFPATEGDNVSISTNIPPKSIHLSFVGGPVHIRDGIFRQRIANNVKRESPASMVIVLTNQSKGISCSAELRFKGKGNCVDDWEEQDDETINF